MKSATTRRAGSLMKALRGGKSAGGRSFSWLDYFRPLNIKHPRSGMSNIEQGTLPHSKFLVRYSVVQKHMHNWHAGTAEYFLNRAATDGGLPECN